MVAENREEMFMQTIASAPVDAIRRNTSSNAPGGGAAVSGRTADEAHRDQNSAGDRSFRSTNSSSPKRIVSGTISIPKPVTSAAGRSQALSVTILTPVMTAPPGCSSRRRRRRDLDDHVVPAFRPTEPSQEVRPRLLGNGHVYHPGGVDGEEVEVDV